MQNWQFWLLFLVLLALNGQLVAVNSQLASMGKETREIFNQNSLDDVETGSGRLDKNKGRYRALKPTVGDVLKAKSARAAQKQMAQGEGVCIASRQC